MNPDSFLIDTHVWIWFQLGMHFLPPASLEILQDALSTRRAYLSAFSIWELANLETARKVELYVPVSQFVTVALGPNAFQLMPLSPQIAIASANLPGELHKDPADRILVATAREEDLTLLTRDKLLLKYAKQGHVRARRM